MTESGMTAGAALDRAALNRMMDLVGNDREMFAEMLTAYFEDAPGFIAELDAALVQGNADRMRIAAHSLKSNSASFGALVLAEQCRALEGLAKAGQLEGTAERIAEIKEEYERTREALESMRMGI